MKFSENQVSKKSRLKIHASNEKDAHENIKNKLIKNSFLNFVTTIFNRIGSLIFTIFLARFLLPEGYGLYSLALSVTMIFYTFTDLGVNQAVIRYISEALSKSPKKANNYYRFLLKIKFNLTIVFSVIMLILSYPLAFYLFKNPILFLPFLIGSVYIFVLSFDSFYQHLFYSTERLSYLTVREVIFQVLRIIFSAAIFIIVGFSYYTSGVFIALILTSIILLIYSLYFTKKLFPVLYEKSDEEIDKKRVMKFVGYFTIASISSVFFSYIDSITLGIFVSPDYIGYYRAAFALVLGVTGFFTFANAVLLPLFTRVDSQKKNYFLNISFKYLSIITIPAIFGLIILGKYFIVLFYGYNYLTAALPMYFLLILIFPTVMVTLFLTIFSSEEKPEIFAKLIILSCIINIIFNFILIKSFLVISPIWATAGAGIATVISWLFYFFASIYLLKKEFNFSISFVHIIKPIFASIIMASSLYFGLNFVEDMNLFFGLIAIFGGIIIYFSILLIIKGIRLKELSIFNLLLKNSKFKIPFIPEYG